ncbi:AsmA family protein [Pseudomonas sp. B392_1p]|uniref:AsmA family protein n=1 Tax=Pseudomonas sp. B392_1p TaxID=3457507 RepID=UPI003FD064FE
MKALGKILGIIFLGLLLILVGLGFALTHWFDPNDYKDEIRQLARDKANLELTLNGDIGWSLFPWLGLELHQTTLASAQTPQQPFAELRMLGLSVRVLPLLRKEVQMSDIRIDGLNLTLQRDEQGHGNWENIGQPAKDSAGDDTPVAQSTPPEPAEGAEDNAALPIQLDIDSLKVNDARFSYHDAQTGQQFSAESIQLETDAIREGASIPLKLSAFFGTNQPVMRARTEVRGNLRFDTALQRYQLENLRLTGEASGEPLNAKTVTFSAQGELLVDLEAQIAEWNSLKFSANQLHALGDLKVRELDDEAQISGGLSIAAFNLRDFLEGLGQTLPEMADANALGRLEMSTRLSGTPNSILMEELRLKLDDTTLTGNVAVADFSTLALRAQLKGDRMDLDRYLPPKSEADSASTARQAEVKSSSQAAGDGNSPLPNAPTQQAWSDAPILPMDLLRQLDFQLAVNFGELVFDKHPITNASLDTQGKDGLITLKALHADLYNGQVDASGKVDVRNALPQLAIASTISKLPADKFIQLDNQPSPIKGLLDFKADFSTRGNSQKSWVDNLNGKADFLVSDGVLVDANLDQYLCRAIATLNRKALSKELRNRDTAFEELRGNLVVTNGVANNPDFKASIPGLAISGNGSLDLRVLGLDYHIGILIKGDQREMPDPACQVNERYVGLEWPLRCRGPLELGAKACRIDQDGLGKIAGKLAGEKLTEKLDEKLGDKVSPELKDALKGLFKR